MKKLKTLSVEEFWKIKRPTLQDWVRAGFVTMIRSVEHLMREDKKLHKSREA